MSDTKEKNDVSTTEKRLPKDGYYPLKVIGAWASLDEAAQTVPGKELNEWEAGVIAFLAADLWFVDTPDNSGIFTVACRTGGKQVLMMLGNERTASPSPNEAYEAGCGFFGEEGWPFVILWIGKVDRPAAH